MWLVRKAKLRQWQTGWETRPKPTMSDNATYERKTGSAKPVPTGAYVENSAQI